MALRIYRSCKVKIYKSQNILIIGGGQAGLLTGYYLKREGLPFLIFDAKKRVGDSWRERYDSLRLLTPRSEDSLPGMKLGDKSAGFPTKDELATYLEKYAKKLRLPIKLNTTAIKLQKQGDIFKVQTDNGIYFAKNIIIATGAFQKPFLPFQSSFKIKNFQIHSANYKNPKQIPSGKVLIVGGGYSGAQITSELVRTHNVTFSTKGRLIRTSRYDLLYKIVLKILGLQILTKIVNILSIKKIDDPNLDDLLRNKKITLKPELINTQGERFYFKDGTNDTFKAVVWATGFQFDYSWIKIPKAFDNKKRPIHINGVSNVEGLYFIYPEKDYGFIKDLPKKVEKIIKAL